MRINLNDQIVRIIKILHVFKLNANLFSILTWNQRGYKILFFKNKVKIRSNNIVIVIKIVRGKIYLLCSINETFFSIEELKNTDSMRTVFISSTKSINHESNSRF